MEIQELRKFIIENQDRLVEEEKWIQKAHVEKGALHKELGIPQDQKIPTTGLKKLQSTLHKKSEAGDMSPKDTRLSRRVNFALNVRK